MLYNYKGFHGCDSKCDIKVYGNIVVATDPDDNYGTSITNMAETIATDIAKMHKIKLKNLVWYQCYDKYNDYSRVEFKISNGELTEPNWLKASRESIQKAIEGLKETTNIR